jgi:signal transduction histidine kinase
MLKRVVAEVQKDEPKALDEFIHGRNGFRTMDLYVFCMGNDGHLDAHPDPKLMGQDARSLEDQSGKHFGAEMLDVAKEGQVSEVKYLFPKPGSAVPSPKTSFVTRVRDQVCGVGYYD